MTLSRSPADMPETSRAAAAAIAIASGLGLSAGGEAIVLQNSNTVTLRLLPCDVLSRVSPAWHQVSHLEVGIARGLSGFASPVAALDPRVEPRVYERDGFVVTLWTYYESATSGEVSPADYASALGRLHAGMRQVDFPVPHFTDRVAEAQRLVAVRDRTPALAGTDREFLAAALSGLRHAISRRDAVEQLLHGEPHPGNVLAAKDGLVFIDLETCCRGPVEFDLAHAPDEVSDYYPGINRDLLRECRILARAMAATWRWDRNDRLPNGRQLGVEWLVQVREALGRHEPDTPPGTGPPSADNGHYVKLK